MKTTYWSILKQYHRELYKSKIYWASAVSLILSLLALGIGSSKIFLFLIALSIILLTISKIKTLGKKIR